MTNEYIYILNGNTVKNVKYSFVIFLSILDNW